MRHVLKRLDGRDALKKHIDTVLRPCGRDVLQLDNVSLVKIGSCPLCFPQSNVILSPSRGCGLGYFPRADRGALRAARSALCGIRQARANTAPRGSYGGGHQLRDDPGSRNGQPCKC